MPLHTVTAVADAFQSTLDINSLDKLLLDKMLNDSPVYIGSHARKSIIDLEDLLPHYPWSSKFKNLSKKIRNEATVALYQDVDHVVNECLEVCDILSHHQLRPMQAHLENYKSLALASTQNCLCCTTRGGLRTVRTPGCLRGPIGSTGSTGSTGATGVTGI